MKIKIKVYANSSQEKIEEIGENNFEVWIKEKAIDGKANKYLEKFLHHRCTPKNSQGEFLLGAKKHFGKEIRIVSGFTSRNKIIEIVD